MGLANGLPRESIGHYTGLGQQILVELNPNILFRDAIGMLLSLPFFYSIFYIVDQYIVQSTNLTKHPLPPFFTNQTTSPPIRDLPSPQCQPNQRYCTAGKCLLTLCVGLWARAQACHQNRKKEENILKLWF